MRLRSALARNIDKILGTCCRLRVERMLPQLPASELSVISRLPVIMIT